MFVIRTRGVVAATLGVMALGACADPDQNTNLRPEGPPDVLAVLVMADAATHLYESATYCKPNDEKRPGLVGLPDFTTQQVCPATLSEGADEVTNAYPDGWYVRIMFDELLDPNIEDLVEILDEETGEGTDTFTGTIANTRPVVLQCESSATGQLTNVAYDGYYSPSGNRITWPLGPSLVIKPNDPTLIATNTKCQITINENVTDKSGTVVPADQRGPYKFSVAPIEIVLIDPADDPDFESPVTAKQIYFDNPYIQFNTKVDLESLCPGGGGATFGACNDEQVFSIKDVEHPNEGPGYCNTTFLTCGKLADCTAQDPTGGDTLCGKGFCAATGDVCNVPADCPTAMDHCQSTYAYDYKFFGLTETEFGIGPIEPVQTERKYTMQFTQGAKLKDRCGRETVLPAPAAEKNTLVRFITDKFDFERASIVTGETASATKTLQYNWKNVVEGHDTASSTAPKPSIAIPAADVAGATPPFTISPLPKKLTAACAAAGAGCPNADIPLGELLFISADAAGQIAMAGHLQLNTEYTATLKAGIKVKDFYGKEWTNPSDMVIKWKTQPAIVLTGPAVRVTGTVVSIGDLGTARKPTSTTTLDIRLGFNVAMDPTTLDVADVAVENVATGGSVPTLALASSSGCATTGNATNFLGTCTLRLRGLFQAGTYKITVKQGAELKDMFGTVYTQAAAKAITITVAEAPPPVQCH